jgi:hypothetical protein
MPTPTQTKASNTKCCSIGSVVDIAWFGEILAMKIIGYDAPTNQVQVQHLDAFGSFYEKVETVIKLNNKLKC